MTSALSALLKADAIAVIPPALRTATVTGQGIDFKDYEGECLVILHCSDVQSGTGVLSVTMQDSDAQGSGFGATVLSVGSVTVTGGALKASFRAGDGKRYKRFIGTNTGGAGYIFDVTVLAQPKYQ